MSKILLSPLVLFGLFACATTSSEFVETPSWYNKLPMEEGWRHASGRSSATGRNKAREYALEEAVNDLAAQMGVKVKSISYSEETESGLTAVIITEQGIEQTVSGFQILEWSDGKVRDRPHLWEVYVLLRIDEARILRG